LRDHQPDLASSTPGSSARPDPPRPEARDREAPDRETREPQAEEPPDQHPDDQDLRGWEALSELTGDLQPGEVDALAAVRELEAVYPLLHALVGRSLRDFFVRAAALEELVKADRAVFSAQELAETLYWLDERARDATLKTLRASGWLAWDPSAGTSLTDAGRWAYDVLAFLHRRLAVSELLPTVAGVEYALAIGMDPLRLLTSTRARLTALYEEIDAALASHSEVVLRRTAARLQEVLALSGRIRSLLDRIDLEHRAARREAREIHHLLSRLHGRSADLHAAVTEVGRQYLRLTAGLTTEQIVRALMGKGRAELAAVGREALEAVLAVPPLLTTEALAHAAEVQALRERPQAPPVAWVEPPEPPRALDSIDVPAEVRRLVADLLAIAAGGEPVPLAEVIPAAEAGEAFLRASLLSLAGDRRAGEGVAGQLGAIPVAVEPMGDGWPEALPAAGPVEGGAAHSDPPSPSSTALTRLTPGSVRPLAEP
jgi:hypothetical protein